MSLNHVVLMGRLTRDPEIRMTASGKKVANFSLAVDRDFKNQNGERETDFFNIVTWRSSEFVERYLSKGQMIAVSGSLRARTYTDKEGNKRNVVEVLAESVYFAESKKTDDAPRRDVNPNLESLPSNPEIQPDMYSDDEDLPF